ncbi:oxygen-dependent protoporphyrinogen oxidase [Goodfellowiella coeruleoviolacea]|uniref:Coproporphyrinogen III oxidase n=1 Tax=Goodfellowiella coeruleoviolacea TaxID=334858 RepID=A0AAE3KJD5_9PSEU|nr:oxygen-dependent protoporphyrinogen oxidase [Goodfellowiella coeruleoviolacea]
MVEQAPHLGGKLRTVEFAGHPVDLGAEAFLHRRPEAAELVAELGLAPQLVHPTRAASTVRAGGRVHRMPSRTLLGVPTSAETVRGVLSAEAAARVAAEPSLPPLRLEGDVAVGALLRERFGDEVTERLVDPMLGGVYAGRADRLSLRATIPVLANALDSGIGSVVEAAAAAMPAPAQPPPDPAPPVFGTLRGGLGALIDRLAEVAKPEVRLGQPVRELLRADHGWRLVIGPATAPEVLDVDGVVLAVPAPSARRLLADIAPTAATSLAEVELASVALVSMALPGDTDLTVNADVPLAAGVLVADRERHADGTPFTAKAFTFSSNKWAHLTGEVKFVRGSVGRVGETELLQRSDEELIEAVRADLAELIGGPVPAPLEVLVTRWGGALPQYGVGHLERVERIEDAVARVPGLAVAGALLHGVGVPACVATGNAAAARVAAHLLGRRWN